MKLKVDSVRNVEGGYVVRLVPLTIHTNVAFIDVACTVGHPPKVGKTATLEDIFK